MLPRFAVRFPAAPPRAVVLLVHGLNLRPQRMDPIADELLECGAAVVRIALSGHRGDYERLVWSSRERWFDDFDRALELVSSVDALKRLPVACLGQSLGALTFCDWLMHGAGLAAGAALPRHALLLSPAIALRPRVRILRPLFAVHRRVPIPSASHREDRAYAALPCGSYRAMFESYRALSSSLRTRPLPVDRCTVVCHVNDELVSPAGIDLLVAAGAVPRARVCTLTGSEGRGARHIAVDRETAGERDWKRIRAEVGRFVDFAASGLQSPP